MMGEAKDETIDYQSFIELMSRITHAEYTVPSSCAKEVFSDFHKLCYPILNSGASHSFRRRKRKKNWGLIVY